VLVVPDVDELPAVPELLVLLEPLELPELLDLLEPEVPELLELLDESLTRFAAVCGSLLATHALPLHDHQLPAAFS
jgi:hypothetical protein